MTAATATTTPRAREIRPQRGPQEAFLSSRADVVIYGGGAGGGKTWGLLVEPLRHVRRSSFRAVIFRRSYPQIINPGGLQDEAMQLYPRAGGQPSQPSTGITWRFPSGAAIRFTHLQRDETVYNWQGAQVPLICFDELTHFTAAQFWYLFSRNRSTSGVRPYIRATTNPEPGWVADLIAWWIDPATGFAIPERSGVIRWFVRANEEIVWADDPDTLRERFPGSQPKSLTFIRARLQDNPILMTKDPGYLANLLALPLVERERLLGGNWKIVPSGGKVFNRGWFSIIPPHQVPDGGVECRFWDFAATEKKLKGDDPDFTASVRLRHVGDTFYILDCLDVQEGPGEVDRLLKTTVQRDRAELRRTHSTTRYQVRWEIEPGSAGLRENHRLVTLLAGYDAQGAAPEGDKITRAAPLAVQAEQGNVVLAAGEWNERWLTHMHHQPDWPHDDIMDASSGAFRAVVHGADVDDDTLTELAEHRG